MWLEHCNTNCHLEVAVHHRNSLLQRRCLHAMRSYAEARRETHHNFGESESVGLMASL